MGGGTVLIMLMSYVFDYSQQMLQTINLLYYIPTTVVAGIIYAKRKYIDYNTGIFVIMIAMVGAFLGAKLATMLDPVKLRKIFAMYLMIIGSVFLFKKPKKV